MFSAFLLASGLASATAGEWEWRGAIAAQIDPSPHGVFDVGARRGAFSAQLLTDTLDVRWAPELDRGRWWVAARGEFGAAGLLISPWSDGAPDPSRALTASYGGVEGGGIRYLPRGLYAGGQLAARYYLFSAMDATTAPVPEARLLSTPEGIVGYWQESLQGWVRGGANVGPALFSPHVAAEVKARPDWTVAPRVELRAGAGMDQDYLTSTRVGGLNPYVVPLAGAGWAEFWVEDYAAARVGPEGRVPLAGGALVLGAMADLVAFRTFEQEEDAAVGLAATAQWRKERWSVEGSWGYAPWLERQEGVSPMAGWLSVGIDFP